MAFTTNRQGAGGAYVALLGPPTPAPTRHGQRRRHRPANFSPNAQAIAHANANAGLRGLGFDTGDFTDILDSVSQNIQPFIPAITGTGSYAKSPAGTVITSGNVAALTPGLGYGSISLTTLALLGMGGMFLVVAFSRR